MIKTYFSKIFGVTKPTFAQGYSVAKKNEGFTLIELLLVIGIITLLSSVVMFNATEAKKKADDSHMFQESKQVETAITLYKEENGFVPHSTHAADGSTVSAGKFYQEGGVDDAKYVASLQPLVDAKILPKIPRSPGGHNYAYGVSTDHKDAVFVANLNDKTKVGEVCVAVGDKYTNTNGSCLGIFPAVDEYIKTLSGGDEKISLIPNNLYQLTYSHSSVNASYGIQNNSDGYVVQTWFQNDRLVFFQIGNNTWQCNGDSLAEGETAYCSSPNSFESIRITNYNATSRIVHVEAL